MNVLFLTSNQHTLDQITTLQVYHRIHPLPNPAPEVKFEDLLGQTIYRIETDNDAFITFETTEGNCYKLYHSQDCCESVSIESIVGNLQDLIDHPITLAEEATNHDNDNIAAGKEVSANDSYTWTFYKLATVKGYVDIRWFGSSNGYYSEDVNFERNE